MPHAKVVCSLVLAIFIGACTLGSWAQSPPAPAHQHELQHEAEVSIDGALHPELIPDSTAYRLFFVALSQSGSATPPDPHHLEAHLRMAGFANDMDIANVSQALSDFRTKYAQLIADYNNSPDVKNNTSAGLALFLTKRDALVQATRDVLMTNLTADATRSLHAHIQREKGRMRIAAQEAAGK